MENTQNHNHAHKIEEALNLLNQAAKEKKEDLLKSVNEKYSHLRDAFANATSQNADTVRQWKKTGERFIRDGKEKVIDTASAIDEQVHRSPWGSCWEGPRSNRTGRGNSG
jgi:hypothetical protein